MEPVDKLSYVGEPSLDQLNAEDTGDNGQAEQPHPDDRDIHDTIFIVLKLIDDDYDLTCSVLSNILTMRGLRH